MEDNLREYYVYEHLRNDNGKVFYVGKGKGDRANSQYRNKFWVEVVKETDFTVRILKSNLLENESLKLESEMISKYGLDNLTNIQRGHSKIKDINETSNNRGIDLLKLINEKDLKGEPIDVSDKDNQNHIFKQIRDFGYDTVLDVILTFNGGYDKSTLLNKVGGICFNNERLSGEHTVDRLHLLLKKRTKYSIVARWKFKQFIKELEITDDEIKELNTIVTEYEFRNWLSIKEFLLNYKTQNNLKNN